MSHGDDHWIKRDKPHDPWGKHVDVFDRLPKINPDDSFTGVIKQRIGPTGDLLGDPEINIKGGGKW